MARIALVDDDASILENLAALLLEEHEVVDTFGSLREARSHVWDFQYDLVVLDVNLLDGSGIDFCAELRERQQSILTLMLTGRSEINYVRDGLLAGADDYLTKPFSVNELRRRIQTILARGGKYRPFNQSSCDIKIEGNMVYCLGTSRRMQNTEARLLEYLIDHQNTVFTSEEIIKAVWPSDAAVSDESVRSSIYRIRKILKSLGSRVDIANHPAVGYSLTAEKCCVLEPEKH